jgi:hypothetical protein
VTNTVGAAIGYALFRSVKAWLLPDQRRAISLLTSYSAFFIALQAVIGFALTPFARNSTYYGQIARPLGNYEVFRGTVLGAEIDGVAIPDRELVSRDSVPERIRHGATVHAWIIPSAPTSGLASIVRVVDAQQEEMILLGQSGRDYLFNVGTGALLLRLRPALFSLRSVFPANGERKVFSPQMPLLVSGKMSSREVSLSARSTNSETMLRIPLTSSLGWTLFMPFQVFLNGSGLERVAGWFWIGLLSLPIGYYAGRATIKDRLGDERVLPTTQLAIWALAFLVLAVGLAVLPGFAGLSTTLPSAWIAALLGMTAGGVVAAATLRVQ